MTKHLRKLGILVITMICLAIPTFASDSFTAQILNDIGFKAISMVNFQVATAFNSSAVIKEVEKKDAADRVQAKKEEEAKNIIYSETDEASGRASAEAKEIASEQNDSKAEETTKEVKPEQKVEEKVEVVEENLESNPEKQEESNPVENKVESTPEAPKTENNSVLPAGSLGIDVSQFNGYIDWNRVKNAGVKYAFIRVGGRFSKSGKFYPDTRFEYNISQAKAHGIKVGVYFFTQAVNTAEAIEEANYTIEKIKPYNLDFPVVIDSEAVESGGRHAEISVQDRTNVIKAFCDTISNAGYTPMVYASTNWLENKLYMNQLSGIKVWVAQYYSRVTYNGSYNIWQYTSTGNIDGINSKVDCNRLYSL